MRIYLLLSLSILFFKLQSQSLKRKALLGIQMENISTTRAAELGVKANSGVHILQCLEHTTADKIGLEPGMIVTNINAQDIHNINDVMQALGDLRAGDPITVTYLSAGQSFTKTAVAVAKAHEQYDNAIVEYGEVNYSGHQLRSILYRPKGIRKAPAVFFIQGYTCASIELLYQEKSPSKQLIDQWLAAGFAVYRVEKAGVGDSKSDIDCANTGFQEELEGFKQAYKTLLNNKDINSDQVFLFGHSMGGIIAPLLQEVQPPKGIITYGTVAKNWYDYMVDIYTVQPKIFGTTEEEIAQQSPSSLAFIKDLLADKKTGEQILNNEAHVRFLTEGNSLESFKQGQFINRHYRYWQELCDVDIAQAWTDVNTKVLALHGEYDIQAINEQAVKDITTLVNKKHPKQASYQIFEHTDHGFTLFESMQENIDKLNDGSYRAHAGEHFNTKIGQATVAWMRLVMN